jgi:hypothetical protein
MTTGNQQHKQTNKQYNKQSLNAKNITKIIYTLLRSRERNNHLNQSYE